MGTFRAHVKWRTELFVTEWTNGKVAVTWKLQSRVATSKYNHSTPAARWHNLLQGMTPGSVLKESRARNLITVSAEICFQWEHGLFRFEVRQNSPVVTLWLTDELSESSPAYKHASLDSKQITWPCCFRKHQWSALGLYRSNREFNFTWIIVYFACLSGWSCLSSGERSTALREHCSSLSTIVSLFYHIKLISGLDVWSWVTVVFLHY